ncbi:MULTISPECIES: hypothetical protein [Rubrivivax]|uniref:hypothetical protein n=1 Tax=Rubrivivax TaxID=28067 RepID=UPI00020A4C8F|nr:MULTISPECIES: hypothetical protein [Rubrivivax]EGJ10728.1 hypothetical protein RBXJA2T_10399 [Rubrivivax benzoatilyticus JA2 = ATCC BAA-35]MCC9597908.1 hypothetical protein [Rubrivivax sp. JA1055]MCC9645835.1 hypothetical protein [Rubrivivax sp. JA1029]
MLWPAFMAAVVLELALFAFVDPASLRWLGGAVVELQPVAVYTVAFFALWVVVAAAAGLTLLLSRSEAEINSRSFRGR